MRGFERRLIAAVLLVAVSSAALACTEPQSRTRPASIQVLIEADSQVQPEVADVEARVERRTGNSGGWELIAPRRFYPGKASAWPLTFATEPEMASPGATYQLVAIARDSRGAVVAEGRVVTRYEYARRDGLRVLFDVRCLRRTELCGPDLTCRGGACVSSEYDPNATPTKADADAGTSIDSGSAPNSSGTATESEACDQAGGRRCAGFNSALPLLCEGGVWLAQAECTAMQRCDTSDGATQGTCRPVAIECIGQRPLVPFCDSEMMQVCDSDLLHSKLRPCAENERCAPNGSGEVTCSCRVGLVKTLAGCEPATNCDSDNGGCDRLTQCRVEGNRRVCGMCPTGWSGVGESGCIPALVQLDVAPAVLTPAFSPDVLQYQVRVGLLTQTLSLSVTAPDAAQIRCNGEPVQSGASWTSPVLGLGENTVEVQVSSDSGVSKQYRIDVQRTGEQQAYIKADHPSETPVFGFALALSGNTLLVGVPYEDSSASGINATPVDASVVNSGAVYVFVWNGDTWIRQAYIKAPSVRSEDYLGFSAVIDGDTIAVGVPGQDLGLPTIAGKVFIYTRHDGVWSLQAQLSASDAAAGDAFGYMLALERDRLVVGAPLQLTRGVRGGAAYVFTREEGVWGREQKLTASEVTSLGGFGKAVALSGDTIAIGAVTESIDAEYAGAVYVFALRGDRWMPLQRLQRKPPVGGAQFGFSLALRGDTLAAGAPRDEASPGEAHVYTRSGDVWTLAQALMASPPKPADFFGFALALADRALLIGAPGASSSARGLGGDAALSDAPRSGAAYLYAATSMGFQLSTYLKAGNARAQDTFGASVVVSADTLVVGAPRESSSAVGINPSADDSASPSAGAAYVFR